MISDSYNPYAAIWVSEIVARDQIHRHGRANVQENFAWILNESGVDLLLCGHTHRYHVAYREENVTNFHVVLGGGNIAQGRSTFTRVDYDGNKLDVILKSSHDGSLIEQFTIGCIKMTQFNKSIIITWFTGWVCFGR